MFFLHYLNIRLYQVASKVKRIWYLSLSQLFKNFIALFTDFYQAFQEDVLYHHFQGNVIPTGLGSN